MANVTVHFRDVDGQIKRFDTTADRIDVYETRALAEQLGRRITENPGGPHASPVLADGPGVAWAAPASAPPSTTGFTSTTAAPATSTGGTSASTSDDEGFCILVNGIVVCGR